MSDSRGMRIERSMDRVWRELEEAHRSVHPPEYWEQNMEYLYPRLTEGEVTSWPTEMQEPIRRLIEAAEPFHQAQQVKDKETRISWKALTRLRNKFDLNIRILGDDWEGDAQTLRGQVYEFLLTLWKGSTEEIKIIQKHIPGITWEAFNMELQKRY